MLHVTSLVLRQDTQCISREVPGSILGGVNGDFFRGTPNRTMCPEVDSASESEYQGGKSIFFATMYFVFPFRTSQSDMQGSLS